MSQAKSTSDRVLFHLKSRGAASAQDIADTFGLTHMGAHKALQGLACAGLAECEDVAEGRGRPKHLYRLTEAGHERFPDRHAELTVELLDTIRKVFGEDGLEQLVSAREHEQRARYAELEDLPLEVKAEKLAEMRAREGYMARVETTAAGDLMLIEDHCPICAAAKSCRGFCRSELEIFQSVLGPEAEVSREEHALSGGRRCTYRIRHKEPD